VTAESGAEFRIGLGDVYGEVTRLRSGYDRLDGKIDMIMSNMTLRLEQVVQAQATERTEREKLAARQDRLDDRLDEIDRRPVVTPRAMWTGLAVIFTAMGTLIALLNVITR